MLITFSKQVCIKSKVVCIFVLYKAKYKEKVMSNQKHTPEERKGYKERLAAIEMMIPANYSKVISEREGVSKDVVRNVRHGRTINDKVLQALEELCEEVAEKMTK
jgi:hypothetical protein